MIRLFLSAFERGGWIMWVILGVSLVVWYLGIDKYLDLRGFSRARVRFLRHVRSGDWSRIEAPVGERHLDGLAYRLGRSRILGGPSPARVVREFLLGAVPALDRGLSTMSAWIAVAPLLGLLGTVTGMIHTFRVITEFGAGSPHLTAEGISMALLTTQAGLTVAFPALLLHNRLLSFKNRLVELLKADAEEIVRTLERPTEGGGAGV